MESELQFDDLATTADDWLEFNKGIEDHAASVAKDQSMTNQQYDYLASGKAAEVNLTDIVEKFLTVDSKPFLFKGRHYMKGIFDHFPKYSEGAKNLVVVSSRQIGKSTSQAAKGLSLGMLYPEFKTLAVSPRGDQVIVYSQQRFNPMCLNSELMMKTFVDPHKYLWQVKAKMLSNGSLFNFRSCYLNADGSRGISAHHLQIDEIQDIPADAVPILEACQASMLSETTYNFYTGTPKTSSNLLNLRYLESCQFEWLTKCRACNYTDNEADTTIIGKNFYECTKCKREIFPNADGRWVPKRPERLNTSWGFRISQIMTQHRTHKDIVKNRDDPTTSTTSWMNETLGLTYDDGSNGITKEMLDAACKDYPLIQPAEIMRQYTKKGLRVYAGVDYGTGKGANPSYTVLTIGAMMRTGVFRILYMKKFRNHETESLVELDLIDKLCKQAGVSWIGADWGHGHHQNERLIGERGWDRFSGRHVLMEFQYTTSHKELSWNAKGKTYSADRNKTMGRMIDAVRNCDEDGGICFFNLGDLADFKNDLMTVYMEYNENSGNYKYAHQLPDDAFHSINYAYMAARRGSGIDEMTSGYFAGY